MLRSQLQVSSRQLHHLLQQQGLLHVQRMLRYLLPGRYHGYGYVCS
jgi:hypothetical protein